MLCCKSFYNIYVTVAGSGSSSAAAHRVLPVGGHLKGLRRSGSSDPTRTALIG